MSVSVWVQYVGLAVVAVLLVVGAYRLDEQRIQRNRGLWRLVLDGVAGWRRRGEEDPLSSVRPAGPRRRGAALVLVIVVVGGLTAAAWSTRTSPIDGATGAMQTAEPRPAVAAGVDVVTGLTGADLADAAPIDAAIAVSRAAFPDGADDVLLVSETPATDALVAASLVGGVDGPVLLTSGDRLSPQTAEEIDRLGAPEVHIVGREAAISAEVEAALVAAGHRIHRDAGATAVGTAVAAAERHAPDARAVVLAPLVRPEALSAETVVPALAAGGLASVRGVPFLPTGPERLDQQIAAYLAGSGVTSAVVVGGTDQLSDQVMTDLADLGVTPMRVAGADAAQTAVSVAEAEGWPTPGVVVLAAVATDRPWATASVGSLLAGRYAAPLLVADGDVLPETTRLAVEARPDGTTVVCAPGVSAAACEEAEGLVGGV